MVWIRAFVLDVNFAACHVTARVFGHRTPYLHTAKTSHFTRQFGACQCVVCGATAHRSPERHVLGFEISELFERLATGRIRRRRPSLCDVRHLRWYVGLWGRFTAAVFPSEPTCCEVAKRGVFWSGHGSPIRPVLNFGTSHALIARTSNGGELAAQRSHCTELTFMHIWSGLSWSLWEVCRVLNFWDTHQMYEVCETMSKIFCFDICIGRTQWVTSHTFISLIFHSGHMSVRVPTPPQLSSEQWTELCVH